MPLYKATQKEKNPLQRTSDYVYADANAVVGLAIGLILKEESRLVQQI